MSSSRTTAGSSGGGGGDRGVVFHSPKQKKEIIAKSIQKSNSNIAQSGDGNPSGAGNHTATASLRHNPPADIIEPKGEPSPSLPFFTPSDLPFLSSVR